MQVTRKQHFLHAALFWTITGGVMGFFGFQWVWFGFQPKLALIWILICALFGLVKGHFAIGKSAKRSIIRINNLPERSPLHHLFGKGTWILILVMMSLGMVIRHLGVEKSYRGIVLAMVGTALFWASRYFWKAACQHPNR